MKRIFYAALVVNLFFVGACGQSPQGKGAGEVESTPDGQVRFRIETVATKLEVPWSIIFTPDGRLLFTERPGRVRVIEKGALRAEPLATIPDVEARGESGLMGLTLHPQFASNHLLYLSYAYDASEGQRIRVLRFRETGNGLADRTLIIENIPGARYHAGCRVRFGPDGKLYITTGDAGQREMAQQLNSLAGKILRLNDDGTVPQDNPFVGRADARPEIWTYGHRNPQGIDWQPGSNLLFETEHGPSGFDGPGGGDEVNIVERGKNYGWPIIHHRASQSGLESPLLEYTPACAPASGTFYRGGAFSQFKGNFFFGCLVGERIIRVKLDGRRVLGQESLLQGKFGRIRDIAEGPDGAIYFSSSNRDGRGNSARDDDRILRLVPVK